MSKFDCFESGLRTLSDRTDAFDERLDDVNDNLSAVLERLERLEHLMVPTPTPTQPRPEEFKSVEITDALGAELVSDRGFKLVVDIGEGEEGVYVCEDEIPALRRFLDENYPSDD